MGMDAADQMHVELDHIGLRIGQHVQSGVAGAKIIDGDLKPERAMPVHTGRKIFPVYNRFVFRDFDNNLTGSQTMFSQKFQCRRQRLIGLLNASRKKIEVDQAIDVEFRGKHERVVFALLVEQQQIVVFDSGENGVRGFSVLAPDQGLIREHLLALNIDDGLKGIGVIGPDRFPWHAVLYLIHDIPSRHWWTIPSHQSV